MNQDSTIILRTFNDSLEASMAEDKLKANGIDCFIENENVGGLNPIGGVSLRVFSKDKALAESILDA